MENETNPVAENGQLQKIHDVIERLFQQQEQKDSQMEKLQNCLIELKILNSSAYIKNLFDNFLGYIDTIDFIAEDCQLQLTKLNKSFFPHPIKRKLLVSKYETLVEVKNQLFLILQQHGVEPIITVSTKFDSSYQEAMCIDETDNESDDGKVSSMIALGYRLTWPIQILIRPEKVFVKRYNKKGGEKC